MGDAAILVAVVSGMIGLLWSARQYNNALQRARALHEVAAIQQNRCEQQLATASQQQSRATDLLDKHEQLRTKAEALSLASKNGHSADDSAVPSSSSERRWITLFSQVDYGRHALRSPSLRRRSRKRLLALVDVGTITISGRGRRRVGAVAFS